MTVSENGPAHIAGVDPAEPLPEFTCPPWRVWDTSPAGVWVVYHHDDGCRAESVHHDEIKALRAAVGSGYQKVVFWPFGMSLYDAVKQAEEPK